MIFVTRAYGIGARGMYRHQGKLPNKMATDTKSLDYYQVIAHLITDVYSLHMGITPRQIKLTLQKVRARYRREGTGLLTKTLPRLGKALDKALLGQEPLDCGRFRKIPGTQLPKLFGELFQRVLDLDGMVLPYPCVYSVKSLRQLLFVNYKLELPYDKTLEDNALSAFRKTEQEVDSFDRSFRTGTSANPSTRVSNIVAGASKLVKRVFADLDVTNIVPRHGPGVVSTKEQLEEKYSFSRYNARIASEYDYAEYFHASLGHFVDGLDEHLNRKESDEPARIVLVPKDSRGPRVISCEPLENMWIQQGLKDAMIRELETNPLTRNSVRFTDQAPNRLLALKGSDERLNAFDCDDEAPVTLDLKEASDRVSCWLVEQLFPEHLLKCLMAVRSQGTIMPDTNEVLPLRKYAPMGSALCFPVLATTVWAIIASGVPTHVRKYVHVYGDDVIVPKAYASDAIERLELVGLLVNKDKSCTTGLFRESCGMDAYNGVCVTPVRLRTEWSSRPAASPYTSWIAYANSMWIRGYRSTAEYIASSLEQVYGWIPSSEDGCSIRKIGNTILPAVRILNRGNVTHFYNQPVMAPHNRYWQNPHQLTLVHHPDRLDTIADVRDTCGYPRLCFDRQSSPERIERSEKAIRFAKEDSKSPTDPYYARNEIRVRVSEPCTVTRPLTGWQALLRYFTEGCAYQLRDSQVKQELGYLGEHDVWTPAVPIKSKADYLAADKVVVKTSAVIRHLEKLQKQGANPVEQILTDEDALRVIWENPELREACFSAGSYTYPHRTKLRWRWRLL